MSDECIICGKIITEDEYKHITDDEESMCESCYDDAEKCVSCEKVITDDDYTYPADDGVVCEQCYEQADRIGTVVTNDLFAVSESGDYDYINDDGDFVIIITDYRNDTVFGVEWRSSGGWRGYFAVSDHEGWIHLTDDNILSGSRDAEELEEFDSALTEYLSSLDVRWAKVFLRSSNVLSTGYDFFVLEQDMTDDVVKEIQIFTKVANLKARYRDEGRYYRTALTGSDDDTKEARILVDYHRHLTEGGTDSPQEFLEKVKEEE